MNILFSIVVPVFNRPEEVRELLESLQKQDFQDDFEIVIVEDGSTERSEAVVEQFREQLQISYYFKENSGPGDSRNFGMQRAKGNYFIILDSDSMLPQQYLSEVERELIYHCSKGHQLCDDLFFDYGRYSRREKGGGEISAPKFQYGYFQDCF